VGTTWRWGVLLDERTADMLDEAQRLSGVSITCTQGCYSGGVEQSAGTHDGGGAVDLSASGLNQGEKDAVLLAGRQVGFALWHRTPSQGNWPYHFHGIAGGCPDLSSGARDQWNDFLAGRNGLANNAPDDGPRDFHYVGITWEEYKIEEILMATPVVFFQTNGGKIWEADLLAGTYYHVKDEQDLKDRKYMLSTLGVPWKDWEPGTDVGNPSAFGTEV
jgi:hypothetical protein